MCRVLNMLGFNSEYFRIVNIPGFWISTYFHKYDMLLYMRRYVIMEGF